MAEPTIKNGDEYFFPIAYEGNGTGQKIGKFVPFTDSGTIANSCIFNVADSPNLNRTISSGSQRRIFTVSFWAKLGAGGTTGTNTFYECRQPSNSEQFYFGLAANGQLVFQALNSSGNHVLTQHSNREFNDTTKWYHFMAAVDTTQATTTNRLKMYVDGDHITSFSYSNYDGGQNYDLPFGNDNSTMYIGEQSANNYHMDGYLAEFNIIDGQQLLPASFGETDTSTGRWVPSTVKPYPTTTTDIAVTVVSSGGNKYALDGVTQGTVTLIEGATYKFDQSDSSNSGHPLRFSTTSDGTHNSGTEYTTGVTTVGTPGSSGAYTQITVAVGAPTLYYYCSNHSGMGGTANTQDQYGGNGARFKFQDSSSLGDDTSGKGNDFTVVNLTSSDQTTDSPTQNHATLSVNGANVSSSFSEGNLKVTFPTSSAMTGGLSTLRMVSGKYYMEATVNSISSAGLVLGIMGSDRYTATSEFTGKRFDAYGYYSIDGKLFNNYDSNSTSFTFGNSYTTNDVIGIAVDLDNDKLYFSKNGTFQNSANPSAGTGGLSIISAKSTTAGFYRFCLTDGGTGSTDIVTANFGQKSFTHTPPTGFVALQQDNLPETDKGITGLTWTKDREATNSWMCIDSSRIYSAEGVFGAMNLNNTNREYGQVDFVDGITKFLKGGHTVMTTNNAYSYMNASGTSYIDFSWVANSGTKVTNTSGSITSTVQANTTAGFSIVQYVGTGSSGSVGHGLSAAPSWMIIKDRDNDSTNWRVYHKSLGGITKYQILNTNGATQTASMWGTPTASAFIIGGTGYEVNESGRNYVAYCWHEVEGYSKFGKWIGTGLEDGPFIYTGFKVRWLLHKANNAASWYAYDTVRSPNNPVLLPVFPDGTYVETPNVYGFDLNSNGFKVRQPTGYGGNYPGVDTYYMAFAEHPFVGDGTNPTTAR